jgi:aspartate-semialdehyde dehydrogenase
MDQVNIAIVGATGMVGRTILKVLDERNIPINNLYLFASAKSAGKTVMFKNKAYRIEELTDSSFDRPIDIALFSAGGTTSEKYAPLAASKQIIVIDNSSAFRMDPEVPLVVPEVNGNTIANHKGIIANPNCSTIQAVVALKPLYDQYGIKRIVYSTYQAVSGSGVKGVKDLEEGLKGNDLLSAYPHPIANNCLPHIDTFLENGYTKEEMKMVNETKKILGDDSLRITATTVRVPVFYSHSESINVEFIKPYVLKDVFKLFSASEDVVLVDDLENNQYPLARAVAGTDGVYVGRLRRDESIDNGLNMWVVADNIRKGAATNAVQIAEYIIKNY